MILNLNIDQESFEIEIRPELIEELKPILEEMDKEYDQGAQMGRFWVEQPSVEQRCQIAANNIVNSMHAENKRMLYIMSAYIVYKLPGIKGVTFNSEFEMHEIDIHV